MSARCESVGIQEESFDLVLIRELSMQCCALMKDLATPVRYVRRLLAYYGPEVAVIVSTCTWVRRAGLSYLIRYYQHY